MEGWVGYGFIEATKQTKLTKVFSSQKALRDPFSKVVKQLL
jgi:hypothetical protein